LIDMRAGTATSSCRCRSAWSEHGVPAEKPPAIGGKAPYPGFIDKVPKGERWIHEIKFDGYRVQLHLANETVRVFTRRGNDWTKRFKNVADEAWHISAGGPP
jgi:bifunctional non-homologous end joining protein LigD